MQTTLSYLLTAVLLAHAAFGCCWHHGDSCGHRATVCARGCRSTACGGQQHAEHPAPGPCKCRQECQGMFPAVPPQKALLATADTLAPFDLAGAFPFVAAVWAASPGLWRPAWRLLDSGAPLRPHLWHQVLLI